MNIKSLFRNDNVSSNTPFLVLRGDNLSNYITLISDINNNRIYKLNELEINKLLKENNINSIYRSTYHILSNDLIDIPNSILLVHDNITQKVENYEKILDYDKENIYIPKWESDEYLHLGLIYGKDSDIYLIKSKYLLEVLDIKNELTTINEFGSIGSNLVNNYSIIRFLDNNIYMDIKLINYDGLILSNINGKAELKNYEYDNYQNINRINEEININNLCLTNNKGNILFSECTNSDSQKWIFENNNLISKIDNKCLSYPNLILSLKDCNEGNNYWNIKDTNINGNLKGKYVALVNSENPWYINKDIVDPIEIKKIENKLDFNLLEDISDNYKIKYDWGNIPNEELFDSSNNQSKYSLLSRINILNNLKEGFSLNYKYLSIVSVLSIIILSCIIIYKIKNKKY